METLPMKTQAQGLKPNKWTYISIMNPAESDNFLAAKGFQQPESDLERAQMLYKYFQDAPDKELARQEILQLHPDKAFMLHNTVPKKMGQPQGEVLNCSGCNMKNMCADAVRMSADGGGKPQMSEKTMNNLMIGGGVAFTLFALYIIFRPRTA